VVAPGRVEPHLPRMHPLESSATTTMTAALQLTIDLSRKLNGACRTVAGFSLSTSSSPYSGASPKGEAINALSGGVLSKGILSNDGAVHADCSTCFAQCGDRNDLGLADKGFALTQDWEGLRLRWKCPGCSVDVHESTELFMASKTAKSIDADPLCGRCRNGR